MQDAQQDGSPVILVADDEPAICNLLRQILEREGYRVLMATTTRSATLLARACAQPIDLLIADIHIPTASGLELARQLRAEHPNVRVLLLSGNAIEDSLEFPVV